MEELKIEVQNILAFIDLGTQPDLNKLWLDLMNSLYDPGSFRELIARNMFLRVSAGSRRQSKTLGVNWRG